MNPIWILSGILSVAVVAACVYAYRHPERKDETRNTAEKVMAIHHFQERAEESLNGLCDGWLLYRDKGRCPIAMHDQYLDLPWLQAYRGPCQAYVRRV